MLESDFVNVNIGGKTQSVLLENPRGKTLNVTDALKSLTKGKNVKLYEDSNKKKAVPVESLKKFVGQTLYL